MKINHIGYAVENIENSIKDFEILGFEKISEITEDITRKVRIVFIKNESYVLELIEPMVEDSPVSKIIKKVGNTPYHLCYETNNIDLEIHRLLKNKFLKISEAENALALKNKKVCFLYKKSIGIIELVEKKSIPAIKREESLKKGNLPIK